jgi:hypothetical protein
MESKSEVRIHQQKKSKIDVPLLVLQAGTALVLRSFFMADEHKAGGF